MSNFIWLLRQSVGLALYAWPISVSLLALAFIALARQRVSNTPFGVVPWLHLALALLFPVALVLCGTVWEDRRVIGASPEPIARFAELALVTRSWHPS